MAVYNFQLLFLDQVTLLKALRLVDLLCKTMLASRGAHVKREPLLTVHPSTCDAASKHVCVIFSETPSVKTKL